MSFAGCFAAASKMLRIHAGRLIPDSAARSAIACHVSSGITIPRCVPTGFRPDPGRLPPCFTRCFEPVSSILIFLLFFYLHPADLICNLPFIGSQSTAARSPGGITKPGDLPCISLWNDSDDWQQSRRRRPTTGLSRQAGDRLSVHHEP